MKSEHRHELKTHELRKFSTLAGEYLQEHANHILIGLTVVLLVAAAAIYWMRSSGATATSAWSAIVNAGSAEDFQNVADRYRGTPVSDWARLRAAENNLENGLRLSFSDRAAAISDLNEAKKEFEAILHSSTAPERVRERALFGMARTLETLAGEDTEPAIKAYEQLIQEFPQTGYKDDAERRIADLRSESTKAFYAWFQKQNPKPEDRAKPQDGPPAAPTDSTQPANGDIPLDAATPPAESTPTGEPGVAAPDSATETPQPTPQSETPPATGSNSESKPAETPSTSNPSTESPGSEDAPADAAPTSGGDAPGSP